MGLTYEQLFDTLRREKSRDELQVLEPDFYALAAALLSEKLAEVGPQHIAAGQRAQIEYQNARRILRELYDRRERKIVTLALHKVRTDMAVIDTGTLQPEEKPLLDALTGLLERNRELALGARPEPVKPVPEAQAPAAQEGEQVLNVRFLAPVPKFVGKDLTVFGPYEEGGTAVLPESIVRILMKKGRAELAD